ncbi:MAG: CDP-alcohol phosphatidyltransferase family protein [Terriglobales bacterium]
MNCSSLIRLQPLKFLSANRLQESIVSGPERAILLRFAEVTPRWINSDHLTILGFLSQCLAGVCYGVSRWHHGALLLGIFFIALNWLGDSLDGTLARFRKLERPRYGFYVDHITDTFAALFLVGGLALSGFVHPAIAFGMLTAFLMLSIEAYLSTYTLGRFKLSYWKLGPTEIRILLAAGSFALLSHPVIRLFGRQFRLFDIGGSVAILGMMIMLIASAVSHTAELYREERIA